MNPNLFDIKKLQLEEIVVVNASINNTTKLANLNREKEQLDISFNLSPGFNFELKKVRVLFECQIRPIETKGIEGKFELAYFFGLENLQELVEFKAEDDLKIAPTLLASIANVVYSTSRGIIYSRCLGTIFKNVILPITSTNDLIKPFE